MQPPKAIQDIIDYFGNKAVRIQRGYWKIFESPDHEITGIQNWRMYWDYHFNDVKECGGALIKCYGDFSSTEWKGANDLRFDLIWPTNHQIMRDLFKELDFGLDGFRSVFTGLPVQAADAPDKIDERRRVALDIFDAMADEAPLVLSRISSYCAHVDFVDIPSPERADHWVNVLWDFYLRYYGRDDEKMVKLPADMQVSERYRLGRKYGSFMLGTFG